MRIAWGCASVPEMSLEEAIALASWAGYEAVELRLAALWPELERRGPEAVAGSLKRRRLAAVGLASVRDVTFRDKEGLERVLAEVHGAAQLARPLGAPWVVVEPGELPDGADERDALREGRETLEKLCRVTERYDVGTALMPLGFGWASIRTVRQGHRVVEGVGRKSLGLALDTFHVHLSGSSLEDLKALPPRSIALLRLGDAPRGEREALRQQHRLPPGQGVAPVGAIVSIVKTLGADPPVVVEAPVPRGAGELKDWARRLREGVAALLATPEPLASR
jgi:sugar phosphate isomerase/epimerase